MDSPLALVSLVVLLWYLLVVAWLLCWKRRYCPFISGGQMCIGIGGSVVALW